MHGQINSIKFVESSKFDISYAAKFEPFLFDLTL